MVAALVGRETHQQDRRRHQAFTACSASRTIGTVAVQHYDFRFDDPATTPPLTTDTWLLRSPKGGDNCTEERIGSSTRGRFPHHARST